jgi:hypothetical protein
VKDGDGEGGGGWIKLEEDGDREANEYTYEGEIGTPASFFILAQQYLQSASKTIHSRAD